MKPDPPVTRILLISDSLPQLIIMIGHSFDWMQRESGSLTPPFALKSRDVTRPRIFVSGDFPPISPETKPDRINSFFTVIFLAVKVSPYRDLPALPEKARRISTIRRREHRDVIESGPIVPTNGNNCGIQSLSAALPSIG